MVSWRTPDTQGKPYIINNTSQKDIVVRPLVSLNVNTVSSAAVLINYSSYTSGINSSVSSGDFTLFTLASENISHSNENHKRERLLSTNADHPASRYKFPLTISTTLGSAFQLVSTNTGSSISIAYSTTTAPIFISYATNTNAQLKQYGSGPQAFNPVYKVVAIAGATSTADTYTGAAGTVPTTTTVFNFDYDYSESVSTNAYGTLKTLSSTMTATLKSTLNISTNNNTVADNNNVDIAWSEDGKYLAATVYTNAATTSRGSVIVMSMDTATKVLSSVATTTYAAETVPDNPSICWSGNSQIWIANSAYSAGNRIGILYNFATATNTLTATTLPVAYQGSILSTGSGLAHVDRFDNGHLLVRIGTRNTSTAINIWNPATSSSVIVINPLTVDAAVTTAQVAKIQMRIGKAYGSSSHLHPFVYGNVDPTASKTPEFLFFVYNSQAGTVTYLGRGASGSIGANSTGDIGFNYGVHGETYVHVYSVSNPFAQRNTSGMYASSSLPNMSNSSLTAYSPFEYAITTDVVYGPKTLRVRPGEALAVASNNGVFFTNSDPFRAISVTEVE